MARTVAAVFNKLGGQGGSRVMLQLGSKSLVVGDMLVLVLGMVQQDVAQSGTPNPVMTESAEKKQPLAMMVCLMGNMESKVVEPIRHQGGFHKSPLMLDSSLVDEMRELMLDCRARLATQGRFLVSHSLLPYSCSVLSKPLASSYLAQASVTLAASRYCPATNNLPPWMPWGLSTYPVTETNNPGWILMDPMAMMLRKEGVLSSVRMGLGVLTSPETI